MLDIAYIWIWSLSIISCAVGAILIVLKLFNVFKWGWVWTTSFVWIAIIIFLLMCLWSKISD
ncbi:hypothetical protein KAR91_79750 [Candidatus Pacearchaeota archaeon]|nr:hypothetical protein [Candidatus Pacearchaeota archaeon]